MYRRLLSAVGCGVVAATSMLFTAGLAAAANPIGHLDRVVYDQKYQTIDVEGWAGDPDNGSGSIRIHIYVDGVGAASVGTGSTRLDVAAVHPALGSHTGFYANPVQPKGRGPRRVCAYAINIGAGGNVLLGCATVDVTWPGALTGHIDRITVDPADPSARIVSGWALDPYDAQSSTPFALVGASGPTGADGSDYLEGIAALPRPDVDHAYPANGSHHGFAVRFTTAEVDWLATDQICLAADYWVPGWVGSPTTNCITYTG